MRATTRGIRHPRAIVQPSRWFGRDGAHSRALVRPAMGPMDLATRVLDRRGGDGREPACRARGVLHAGLGWRPRSTIRDQVLELFVRHPTEWACSAVGSAPEWHSGGHGFDSRQVHQSSIRQSRCLEQPRKYGRSCGSTSAITVDAAAGEQDLRQLLPMLDGEVIPQVPAPDASDWATSRIAGSDSLL